MIIINNVETETYKCPKCGALWRAEGSYDYDLGGWNYEGYDDRCPLGCKTRFGFKLKGVIQGTTIKRKEAVLN